MAKKELTKEQKWCEEIILQSFRTERKMIEYMDSRPEEKWHKVLKFSDRAVLVFGEVQIEDGELFENNKGQFINPDCLYLYSISLEEYIQGYNLLDDDDHPILVDYFKKFCDSPNEIASLIPEAYAEIKIPEIVKKTDFKPLNEWAKKQIMDKFRPDFYNEKIYAYLIVIVGEFFRKTNLHDVRWEVLKKDIKHSYKYRPVDHIYMPYLVDENDVFYDIVFSFRQNLFLSNGANHLISKVNNNIKERDVEYEWMQRI